MAMLSDSKLLYSGPDWDFELIRRVHEACGEIGIKEMGLDPYPNQIEVITTEQMLDAYASTGMPLFYRHWSFGKEFARNEALYRKGYQGLAYEIVINSNPCLVYIMEENSATMQTLVIAHAGFGHSHFFKNNYVFKQWTDADGILDYLEFARGFIAKCEDRYGQEEVERVLDAAHALQSHGVHRFPRKRMPDLRSEEKREEERRRHGEQLFNDLWRTVPQGKRSLYSGNEPTTTKPVDERTQAAAYDLGLRLAFCQPTVDGILLFHSQDETALPSWQSGVYYADGTPKSSFWAVRDALARTRGGSIAHCDGMSLEVAPLGVRFPGPSAFRRGTHSVRFRCSLDCAWTLEAVRSTTGAVAARVNGYGRADTPLVASLGKKKLGAAPVRLRLTLVHPVNPGTPQSVTSGLLRAA